MVQPGLAAKLEALVAGLHDAIRDDVEAAAAIRLAHDTQAFLVQVTFVHTSPDASAHIAPLTSATSSALPVLTTAMRLACKRVNQWKACSGNAADLWLLLAASELLRIAAYVAEFAALTHQERVTVAQVACSSFLSCGRQLAGLVLEEVRHGGTPAALDDLVALHGSLMALAQIGIWDVQQLGLDAAKLAPPAELLSCLALAVGMAKVLGISPATGRELRMALPNLARTLYNVAQCPAWEAHAAAFAQHEGLLADALAVILPFLGTLAVGLRLPEERRPHGCMWPAAGWVAGLVTSAVFAEALDDWVAAADGASTAAAIAAAAQLVQQLPLDELQQPGQEAAISWHTAVMMAALPGCLCVRTNAAALARQGVQQRRRVLAQLLPAVCRLPQLLRWAAGSSQQSSFSIQCQRDVTVIMQAVHSQVALLCRYVNDSMRLGAPFIASSLSDAAAWADAAAAALRCLPLLHELHSQLLHLDVADAAVAADLAHAIDELQPRAAIVVYISACQLQTAPEAAATEALNATWALHSAMCQRVHFGAAASGSPFQLAGQVVACSRR